MINDIDPVGHTVVHSILQMYFVSYLEEIKFCLGSHVVNDLRHSGPMLGVRL